MLDQRYSDNEQSKRDIPSFIEPRPPLISNPFMRPRPQKGTNLLELFEEDSETEEPELVQVYLRMKPHYAPNNLYEVRSDRCLITSVDTATAGHGRRTQHNISKMYTFSHIFGPEASQKEIFENVVKDNLKKLPDGHSFTLLTYGASGSGKTYTLMGTVASPGLVPRSLEYVFRVVDAAQQPLFKPADGGAEKLNYAEQDYELQWVKKLRHVSAPLRDKYRRMSVGLRNDITASTLDLSNRTRHYVWVSFVEIYNEGIYDLLATTNRSNASKLRIREDANGHVYVKGTTQAFVRTGEEAYDVMVAGKHNLQVAATGVHAHSSRSHCIFTITMLTETDAGVRSSCVRLCDLAGCERARHTKNTGARMAESRAINSSLHVLERCLHTLRRRARTACVPYRESKLTRLLGAGLSGARGEAVSMVVTLNPAVEFAHETRHVLQLAAVARDIQVNNTIAETTLETTQDSTLHSSIQVMKLRADNERLHFELLQAQARNKELMSVMEEKQQQAADTMRELVEEAKDMTRQYYESQMQSLKSEMEEMTEEYEDRLSKATALLPNTDLRTLQNKVAKLMTEIAILEEKLTAEHLARARAEEEVQHLRACIEERDEKAFEENSAQHKDVMMLTDSEHESDEEDDPCNESLEPTFKKEDINRSVLQMKNGHQNTFRDESTDLSDGNNSENTIENELDASIIDIINKSGNTLKDSHIDNDTTNEPVLQTGEDNRGSSIKTADTRESTRNDSSVKGNSEDQKNHNLTNQYCKNKEDSIENQIGSQEKGFEEHSLNDKECCLQFDKGANATIKGTSFVENAALNDTNTNNSNTRGTYFIDFKDSKINATSDNIVSKNTSVIDSLIDEESRDKVGMMPSKVSETLVGKIVRSIKSTHSNDTSLAQFEKLEMAANNCDDGTAKNRNNFEKSNALKDKKTYFDDISENSAITEQLIPDSLKNKEKKTYFDNIDVNMEKASNKKVNEIKKGLDHTRSPSIVKDDIECEFKPSTMKILLGDSLTRQHDVVSSVHKNKLLHKKQESIDIFEGLDSPQLALKLTRDQNFVENARKSIEKLVLEQTVTTNTHLPYIIQETVLAKSPTPLPEYLPNEFLVPTTTNLYKNKDLSKESNNKQELTKADKPIEPKIEPNKDNTIDEFENIYKDITGPRDTEFDLLVQDTTNSTINEEKLYNKEPVVEESKYNLRHKTQKESVKFCDKIQKCDEEVLLESHAKCESKSKTTSKRSLRLKRRKHQDDSDDKSSDKENDKLKDIVNLQKEFSDVTMDFPAPVKEVKDIASPEKPNDDENLPRMSGIQSCPSKSVTRSRRKLFTPRAEPLDESDPQHGDSTERLYVPRPSYHRARARRKL